jgi:hypothetical protein
MLLAGADSIREVITFPKSGGGYDPLTGAPAPITAEQRKEAGIDVLPPDPAEGVVDSAASPAVATAPPVPGTHSSASAPAPAPADRPAGAAAGAQ